MNDLIEALTILQKYLTEPDTKWPTHCEHDVLYVAIDPGRVTPEDAAKLKTLGFLFTENGDDMHPGAYSYRFGSC